MDATVQHALKTDGLIDITTTGKKSGKPHRIEISFLNLDDGLYISGLPGKRDWYANLVANPRFTFHLKQSAQVDIPATATPITNELARKQVLTEIVAKWGRQAEIESFLQHSHLVRVQLETTE